MVDSRESGPGPKTGGINWRVVSLAGAALSVVLVGLYFWLSRPAPEPTTSLPPAEGVAPATSAEERGDSAREVIADLKNAAGPVDYAHAYARANEFRAAGRHADAQLLYFFAAKGAHAPAAFDLATMYDPNRFSSGASLMDKADPFQAYKWYKQAQTAGDERVGQRLADLRAWAEKQSNGGDTDAERLLLQWE